MIDPENRRQNLKSTLLKQCILICFMVMGMSPVFTQEETLLKGGIRESGGFGGPTLKIAQVREVSSVIIGGRGGWIINNQYVIGGGGYALVTDVELEKLGPDTTRYLDFGYGGLEFEYVSQSDRLVHWTVHTQLGLGDIRYRDKPNQDGENGEGESRYGPRDEVFVFEPGFNVEINVTTFFRLNLGTSYRAVLDTDIPSVFAGDLSGLNGV